MSSSKARSSLPAYFCIVLTQLSRASSDEPNIVGMEISLADVLQRDRVVNVAGDEHGCPHLRHFAFSPATRCAAPAQPSPVTCSIPKSASRTNSRLRSATSIARHKATAWRASVKVNVSRASPKEARARARFCSSSNSSPENAMSRSQASLAPAARSRARSSDARCGRRRRSSSCGSRPSCRRSRAGNGAGSRRGTASPARSSRPASRAGPRASAASPSRRWRAATPSGRPFSRAYHITRDRRSGRAPPGCRSRPAPNRPNRPEWAAEGREMLMGTPPDFIGGDDLALAAIAATPAIRD